MTKNKQIDAGCYWIYILHCENNTYYTGYTTDLARRYEEHLVGSTKCKYTRSFKPLKIAQSWKIIGNKSEAMKIERLVKKMQRYEKEKLILSPETLLINLTHANIFPHSITF